LTNAAVAEAGGTVIVRPSGLQFAGAPSGTNGLAPASAYLYSGTARIRSATGILPGFNFNEFSLSFPESERYGGYLSASHKIYGDQLVAYADGYFQNVKTHNELAPPATGNFQTTGATTIAIPPREPNPAGTTPFGGPTYAATGVQPGAFNPFNPSIRSSPAARAPAWLSLGTAYSTMKPTRSSRRSAFVATNCSTGPGGMTPRSVTAR
jgi:hypothetical protein